MYQKKPEKARMSQQTEKLTGILLNGKNYHLWARQATFGLDGQDKLEHIPGEKPQPVPINPATLTYEEKKSISEWRKSDHLVISWLLAIMELRIFDLMTYQNAAQEIWDKAETLFDKKKNFAHIY